MAKLPTTLQDAHREIVRYRAEMRQFETWLDYRNAPEFGSGGHPLSRYERTRA